MNSLQELDCPLKYSSDQPINTCTYTLHRLVKISLSIYTFILQRVRVPDSGELVSAKFMIVLCHRRA